LPMLQLEPLPSSCLLGYSAGSNIAPGLLISLKSHAVNVGCMVLIDPGYTSFKPPDIATRIIATSVIDYIPDDLDAAALEDALVATFPSFKARFAAAHSMASGLARGQTMEAYSDVGVDTHTLLLISTDHHPILSPIAGGPPAEEEWSRRLPQAGVLHIKSNHATIPYTVETAWCIMQFLGNFCGQAIRHDQMCVGLRKFVEIDGVMDAARNSFKLAWSKSKYALLDFRVRSGTARISGSNKTNAVRNLARCTFSRGSTGVRALLAGAEYVEAPDVHGYDDVALLLCLDRGTLAAALGPEFLFTRVNGHNC